MPSFSSLPISGYREQPLANTFVRQDAGTLHLGIVFPGLGYSSSMPVCYYPGLVLREMGADLLNVEYAYTRTNFSSLSNEEQLRWLLADAQAAVEVGLRQRGYTRITLVGKSLGTLAVAALLENRADLPVSACIWLTPVLTSPLVRQKIAAGHPDMRSMLAIGSADSFYRPEWIAALQPGLTRPALILPSADHSLEVPGDPLASLHAMQRLVEEIISFLKPL
jgi:hypothetical protein